jgi:allantoinase
MSDNCTPIRLPEDLAIEVLASSHVFRNGRLAPATIAVSSSTGTITAIYDVLLGPTFFPLNTPYHDYSPHVILPGLVDAHVHLNEPGRTEWEGFFTGTKAAACGGVTTVIDMPLNAIPPTTTMTNLQAKIDAARGKCWVDVGFYGGIVPSNIGTGDLGTLVEAGVRGFKGFLCESGVEEFPMLREPDIRRVFEEIADEPTMVMFHAELVPPEVDASVQRDKDQQTSVSAMTARNDPTDYETFLQSRPPEFETSAIAGILSLTHHAPNLPVHIVHLSAVDAVPLLREARSQGALVTAETCPHYLALTAESVQPGDTRQKCCPPIRSRKNQDMLWEELLDEDEDDECTSVIKTIVSDHSPCTPELKFQSSKICPHFHGNRSSSCIDNNFPNDTNFLSAWGGVSSLGLTLPILWTEMHRRGLVDGATRPSSPFSSGRSSPSSISSTPSPSTSPHLPLTFTSAIAKMVKWCCLNTARQVGLQDSKGDIREGMDADLCIFDPTAEWTLENSAMLFKNKHSAYQGKTMRGMVRETWLRGRPVFVRDAAGEGMLTGDCRGKLLLNPRSQ